MKHGKASDSSWLCDCSRWLYVRWLAVVASMCAASCAGPQPLRMAINPLDEDAYIEELDRANGDARTGFANWMAKSRDETVSEFLTKDACLSATRNPFNHHSDAEAISRGAVTYKIHCARCHGENADGIGPSTLPGHPATSFKTFGKRFAATLHGGAPRKWFHVIHDGSGDPVDYPDGRSTAMPPFGDKMTREQIWLVITYLQSLDMYADKHHANPVGGKESTP